MSINRINNHPEFVNKDVKDSITIDGDAYAVHNQLLIAPWNEALEVRLNEDSANMEQFSAYDKPVRWNPSSELIMTVDATKWNEGKAKQKGQNQRISKALRRTIVMLRIAVSRLMRQDKSKD